MRGKSAWPKSICKVAVMSRRHPMQRSLQALWFSALLVVLLASVPARLAVALDPQLASSPVIGTGSNREWRFRVFLDDREIGYHHFFLEKKGSSQHMRSIADFEYKLLFVKLYDYRHQNSETWRDGCLQRIESSTNANGKPFSVSGRRQAENFVVRGSSGEAVLPACVMSFAYWDPRFLDQTQLLNSQNGEYLEVETSLPVRGQIQVRGKPEIAYIYRLEAGKLELEIWYSKDQQWLGLQSRTEGGRMLRYELM